MALSPFEIIEHTADIGILARGPTLAQVFQNAALGMFSLMINPSRVVERVERPVEVEARDLEGLLVAWLSELLYIFEVEGTVFCRFLVEEIEPRGLRAKAYGESFDPARHEPHLAVKAVTRHQLSVREGEDGWEAHVILDI